MFKNCSDRYLSGKNSFPRRVVYLFEIRFSNMFFRSNCLPLSSASLHIDDDVVTYTCDKGINIKRENETWTNGSYNQGKVIRFYTELIARLCMLPEV